MIAAAIAIDSVSAQTQIAVLAIAPSNYTAHILGEKFSVNITVANINNLAGWKAQVSWDPSVLSFDGASEGAFLIDDQGNLFVWNIPKSGGKLVNDSVEIQDNRLSSTGVSGNGVLATLVFAINSPCVGSPITLNNTLLEDPNSNNLAHQVQNSEVTFTPAGSLVANAGGDQLVNEDTPVALNASRTYPQNDSLTFTWTFFDQKTIVLDGIVVTYVFDTPGIYPVILTVRDTEGNVSRDSVDITVRDTTLPKAIIELEGVSPNQSITVGQQLTFSGVASFDPENGTITSYYWDIGSFDINDTYKQYTSVVTGEYHQAGTYNISLTVTEDGGNNGTATFTITIRRASDPLDQTDFAILAGVTVLVLVCSPTWLLRRRSCKHES